ncbi:uncharacterized protein LOC116028307 [Ipomoea triloba]|uniref:uncharacterized protein LOC116028307 n=1 Tax=Ipomoea triloba TaxID=35885 RepID=UPI00125E0541|nr:uncharacterized protein LOC116028307 [Ipomoea triloba]
MATQPLSLSTTIISQLQMTHVEEKIIIEQVKDTHNPNGGIDVDANCLFKFVKDIFNFNTVPREAKQGRLQLQEQIQKEISFVVLQLSFVIAFTCVSYDDSHSTAIYLLSLLSKYMWHAKGVMLLACFAIIQGKSKVASQSCHRKGLSYNLATLRNSQRSMLSPDNEILFNESIRSMFDLITLMVELRHSSSMFLANYWIARNIVAYAHLLILGLKPENEIMTEVSNVSTKIKEILASSLPLLEAKRAEENYQMLLHAFDNSSNIRDVVKLILNFENDKEEFEGEGMLLLISSGKHYPFYAFAAASTEVVSIIWVPIINDLDEHIQVHNDIYQGNLVLNPAFLRFLKDKCFPTFQVGGDPIVISLDNRGRLVHYNALHMLFTWGYRLFERPTTGLGGIIPSLENELREITSGADRVIDDINKQIHNFAREVRVKINDWIEDIEMKMKSSFRAYNFTREMEQELWIKESWNLNLVVGWSRSWPFEWMLNNWIDDDEKYFFLCGGNNINQVLEFIVKVQEVDSRFQMDMKIAYLGRRGKMIEEVSKEVSRACDYVLDHTNYYKRFWTRLYSMASSRIQYLNKVGLDEGSDEILQGLRKLLSYEDKCTTIGSWALLGKGKRIIACDMSDKMIGVLNEYEKWKNNAHANDFEQAFMDCYEMLNSSSSFHQHPYCTLNYSSNLDKISEAESCPQCNQNMHKFVTFSCCHGPTNYLYYEEEDDDLLYKED